APRGLRLIVSRPERLPWALHKRTPALHESIPPPLQSILKPFRYILEPLRYILEPLRYILEPFQAILKPFQAILKPFQAILKPFQDILKSFQDILKSFQDILETRRWLGQPRRAAFYRTPRQGAFYRTGTASASVRQLPQPRHRQHHLAGLRRQLPLIAARPCVATAGARINTDRMGCRKRCTHHQSEQRCRNRITIQRAARHGTRRRRREQ